MYTHFKVIRKFNIIVFCLFRETALLVDPENSSSAAKQWVGLVVGELQYTVGGRGGGLALDRVKSIKSLLGMKGLNFLCSAQLPCNIMQLLDLN